jgi:DNA-directed RNA polymerase specialized sigma24 family protein
VEINLTAKSSIWIIIRQLSHPLSKDPEQLSKPTKSSQWFLTTESFAKLLAAFSEDRDEAARQYEALRNRLIRFFEWRSVNLADHRTDEVLNRVARRIDEGQQVENVVAYSFRVAYLVFLESQKEPEFTEIDPERAPLIDADPGFEDEALQMRQKCFDVCLSNLSGEKRRMLLEYYAEERRAKIERRKQLADQLRISLDALRIRAHRIRKSLEECIMNCLRSPEPARNVTH